MTVKERASKLISELDIDRIIAEFIIDYDDVELREELIYQLLDKLRCRDIIIDKASQWLQDNVDKYLFSAGYGYGLDRGELINDFQKAMQDD